MCYNVSITIIMNIAVITVVAVYLTVHMIVYECQRVHPKCFPMREKHYYSDSLDKSLVG